MKGKNFREENVKIFNDTLTQIDKSKLLKEAVEKSISGQIYYTGKDVDITRPEPRFENDAEIIISKKTSFDAARAHSGKVCVLNFASATNPGGGVIHGSGAQEECLCRCSTLYKNLTTKEACKCFYEPHRAEGNPLHNDDAIYSPGVTIIKSDAYSNLYQPAKVDVITCAAPNLRDKPANKYNSGDGEHVDCSDIELTALHIIRARRILNIAAANGADVVVLGAFGCGAFKNDPYIVAKAYKNVIREYMKHFKKIEFAIYCRDAEATNYNAFKEVFENGQS